MYQDLVKRLQGLDAGSASAWNELIRTLSEPKLRLAGDNVGVVISNTAKDEANCLDSTLTVDQHNRNSGAWALYVRRGDANINMGRLFGAIRQGHAIGDWYDSSGTQEHPAVEVIDDITGDLLTVLLPRTCGARDPNVRRGAALWYAHDSTAGGYELEQAALNATTSVEYQYPTADGCCCPERPGSGNAVCVSDYLDDPIDTVKGWRGALSAIRAGWELCTDINGTDPKGKVLPQYDPDDTDYNALGKTGGTKTHTHEDHEINDHLIETVAVDVATDFTADFVTCIAHACYTRLCVIAGSVGSQDCG